MKRLKLEIDLHSLTVYCLGVQIYMDVWKDQRFTGDEHVEWTILCLYGINMNRPHLPAYGSSSE